MNAARDAGEFTVATTTADVEALRPAWQARGVSYVDAELDYFLALVRTRPEVIGPYVIVMGRPEEPDALVVARTERAPFPCRLGYTTLYRPVLRTLRVSHGGIAGADDDGTAAKVVRRIEAALAGGSADVAVVPAVRLGSALDRALKRIPAGVRLGRFADPAVHRRLVLPQSYEQLLATRDRKSRYNLKRQRAQLEKEFGDDLRFDVLSRPEDFDRIFADLESIAAKTYQRGLAAGFADTLERRELARVALERGWFRAWVLAIGERPVAFWQGNVLGRTYYSSSTGYDPEFTRQGVGTVLLLRVFEDLCGDPDVDVVDFGWGDADYKARWGNEEWYEHDLVVFAPSARGVRVNAIRTGILGADRAARRLGRATGLTAKVKRRWRSRLRAES